MSADDLDRQISEKTNRGCLLLITVAIVVVVALVWLMTKRMGL